MLDEKGNDQDKTKQLQQKLEAAKSTTRHPAEAVYVVASNRAIEKALALGLHFMAQDGLQVLLRTGTVSVIDDIIRTDPTTKSTTEADARLRNISSIEIAISTKATF